MSGTAMLEVLINERGESVLATVNGSSGSMMLDMSALETIGKWKFEPALQGDTPVCMTVLIPVIFKLD